MENKALYLLLLMFFSISVFAQPPAIQWQKCYGGTGNENARVVQQTTDGGYIAAGRSNSVNGDVTGNQGNHDYWVVKLDALGLISWQRSLGGVGIEEAMSIQQTTDGGYIVAGSTGSFDGRVR